MIRNELREKWRQEKQEMLLNQMLVDERYKAEADKNYLQNKLWKANEELAALKSRNWYVTVPY